jgi:1-acyl-sn-glycerol-3-phosphate acyltransferase
MKLYDLYTLDGTFVDTLTRKEAVEMFNLSGWDFKSKIEYGEPINGEYYLDDLEDDVTVRKRKDKDMLAQFDSLTSKLRKVLKVEGK